MAAINRSAISEFLWPGIETIWGNSYTDWAPEWPEFMEERTSSKAYEIQQGVYGFSYANEMSEGEQVTFDEAGLSWGSRIEMRKFGLAFIVTREAIEDNQYDSLIPGYTKALKKSMLTTKEVKCASILARAQNASYKGGDGQPLVSASHPLRNGSTASNVGANADLNETSLEAAAIKIGDMVDERGLPIQAKIRKLVIPNGLQFTAERLFRSELRVGTSNNDINTVKQLSMVPEGYRINHYLTDRAAWFLLTDQPNCIVHYKRRALEIENGDGMENQVLKVMATERYGIGWIDWRGIYGNAGG